MPRPLFDYGCNMVRGLAQGAVIFTNGDNDTYPPLACRTMTGEREDVIIVNLSLLNTKWYAQHVRRRGVPMGLSANEIDALEHTSEAVISDQLQMRIYEALESGGWMRPLYYAVTVPGERQVVPGGRRLEGLAVRVLPGSREEEKSLDVAATRRLFDTIYRLDGMTDPLVDWEREGSIVSLGMNYVNLLWQLGSELYQREPAEDGGPYLYRAIEILAFHDRRDHASKLVETWAQTAPKARLLESARELLKE
ncbi:MAG: hypothetical protein GF355_05165 [Candidatus Eisenbacteria bacterium]|nr:hypothetical protein [Candidatus Eisenbacteria bacterium]